MSDDRCRCGRPMLARSGELEPTCAECRSKPDHCDCPSIGTKKEERTKPAAPTAPAIPSAEPAMYAGVLGDITAAAAPTTEADPVGIYASLLAGVGVLIGPGPHVRVGNTRHPLLIWPLLLGRTGSGRKGEATCTAEIFLRKAAPDSADRRTVTGLSSGEGLIERIRDSEDEDEDRSDKRLLVIEPEFTSVMARSKREGSTLAAVQRQAWDGRALSVLNRQQLRASASHVAIIGHITPQEFRLRLADADMTGGTYNRYLPVFVERSQRLPIPEGVSEHTVETLGGKLYDGIAAAREVGQIQLGREATQVWTGGLYDEFTEADDEDRAEAEFTRRAAPYCLRVAGLLAALEGRGLVGPADLAAAAALVRYSIASAKFVLDRQARNPRLDRIRRAIDAAGAEGLSRSAVSALFSRNLPRPALEELLAELISGDEYEESRTATRGRPALTYRRVLSSYFVPIEGTGAGSEADTREDTGDDPVTSTDARASGSSPPAVNGQPPAVGEAENEQSPGPSGEDAKSAKPGGVGGDDSIRAPDSDAQGRWLARRDPSVPDRRPPGDAGDPEHELCWDALTGRCLSPEGQPDEPPLPPEPPADDWEPDDTAEPEDPDPQLASLLAEFAPAAPSGHPAPAHTETRVGGTQLSPFA